MLFDIKQYYTMSPENYKSTTIIKMVNVVGKSSFLFMVIFQGQDFIVNQFLEDLLINTYIKPSNLIFTVDKIVVEYPKHFIKNSDVEPNAK